MDLKDINQMLDPVRWDGILQDIAYRHQVPGLLTGMLWKDPVSGREKRMIAKAGVTSRLTGVEVDTGTVGQIGSITKLFTATMILQLQEEQRLEIGTPVAELVPGFAPQVNAPQQITVWNLLTHTSGLDGDVYAQRERGANAVEQFVESLNSVEVLFQPGTGWSYCNSGFVLAGRIIELLDGRTWEESLRCRIGQRLGSSRLFTFPEEVLPYSYMSGHIRAAGGNSWEAVALPDMIRGRGPAGIIVTSISDLMTFGASFISGGQTPSGQSLLTMHSIAEMTRPHWNLGAAASLGGATHWGLGVMLDSWGPHPVWQHSGVKHGNRAWLYMLPEDGLILAIFGNGGAVSAAAEEITWTFADAFLERGPSLGASPAGLRHADRTVDHQWLGTYWDTGAKLTVSRVADDSPVVKLDRSGMRRYMDPDWQGEDQEANDWRPLIPTVEDNSFVFREDPSSPWTSVSFTTVDGRPVVYMDRRCLPMRSRLEHGKP